MIHETRVCEISRPTATLLTAPCDWRPAIWHLAIGTSRTLYQCLDMPWRFGAEVRRRYRVHETAPAALRMPAGAPPPSKAPCPGKTAHSPNLALMIRIDGLAMNRTDIQPVHFVDDGYPEAQDYANNYIVLPQRHDRNRRPRTLRATRRLLRRRLRKLVVTIGQRGIRIAGTRTPATPAQYS